MLDVDRAAQGDPGARRAARGDRGARGAARGGHDEQCDEDGAAQGGDELPQAERVCQVGVKVHGRLRARRDVWVRMGATAEVMAWIDHGYRLPLTSRPPNHLGAGNHLGARTYADWLGRSVQELVKMGAMRRWLPEEHGGKRAPRVVSPLNVIPKADYDPITKPDRLRLIIDTRWLNNYQQKLKFKYETLSTNRGMFIEGDDMFSVDFTSGYYHIDIHDDDQELLGVEVNGEYYVFASLPFGLRDACRAFTKVVLTPVQFLRRRGYRVLPYIDDLLFALRPGPKAEEQRDFAVALLREAGFLVGDKSDLVLGKQKRMLGFLVDTESMRYSLPPDRAEKFDRVATALAEMWRVRRRAPARQVARVTGHVAAMSMLLERQASLGCRFLNDTIREVAQSGDWSRFVAPSEGALGELQAWIARIPVLPWVAIQPAPLSPPDVVLVTDASDFATGGFIAFDAERRGWLTEAQRLESGSTVPLTAAELEYGSALRELIGATRILRRHAARCRGKHVEIRTDAMAAMLIYDNGGSQRRLPSGELGLHEAVLALECAARLAGVLSLTLNWFPREEPDQVEADRLSKVRDFGDWWLSASLFAEVMRRLGQCEVDCFADEHSHQLAEFHSRDWSPSAARFDTFTASWAGRPVYLCPPPQLLFAVVSKARRERAFGVIVCPVWPAKGWWPMLFSREVGVVVESFRLPHDCEAFGTNHRSSVVAPGCFSAPLLAARFDCRHLC